MADSDLGQLYGAAGDPRRSVSTWMNIAGALTSVALVAGLGVWGYKLLMRDVTGVPVVRALEGPMREAPKEPGGALVAHQGLTVNQVAAEGEAGEIADQLVLAPGAASLREQDLPVAALPSLEAVQPVEPTDVKVDEAEMILRAVEASVSLAADTEIDGETAPKIKLISASVAGVSRSPRPVARPEERVVVKAVATPETVASTETVEISASSLPAGSRLVQVGAFETPDLARQEWARFAVKYEDVMAGKSRVIQEATSGGKTFYRLRVAGFDDLADARRFCATLVAGKSLCVPVATR